MPERRRKRTNQDCGTDEVKQDRSLLLYVLLSFVTFSVYHFYFMDLWAKDVNILCEKDGKHTVGVEKNDAVQCPDIRRVQICVACGDRGSHL